MPEYEVMTQNITDEAVAVAYHFLEQSIRELDYEDGAVKKMLILDCGGGTSDMVNCNYKITNEGITSRLEMHVTYAHGDTNFGGNELTWRVMQYLKIRLAEVIRKKEPATMDELFPGILSQLYEKIDRDGVEKAYETFSEIYNQAEALIPTCFDYYQNQPEHAFLKVRIDAYRNLNMDDHFFRSFFELLIGTDYVRKMIKEGKSAEEIKARWKDDVEKFKVQRKPYLLYEE